MSGLEELEIDAGRSDEGTRTQEWADSLWVLALSRVRVEKSVDYPPIGQLVMS